VFEAPRYLLWARRYYGKVEYDLASSGMTRVTHAELGDPGPLDDPRGDARYRAAIARFNDVTSDEAQPALGTTHALWLAYAALLSPGDDVLVEEPSYEPVWRIAEYAGARVVRFERSAKDGYAIDPARVAAAITPRTRLISVTNLHNPTGVRAKVDALQEVAKIAEGRGAYLLVDEVYAPFDDLVEADGVWRGSARKVAPNVIAVSSLTKCFGVGIDRVGWLLGAPDVVRRAQGAIIASCGDLPLVHANFAAHAMTRVPWLASRAKEILRGKRDVVANWVRTRPDLAWSAPKSGLFGFAKNAHAGDLLPLVERAAKEHGVLVAAGSFFGVPNGFRLSLSISREKLEEGLARLGRGLPPS
jgi:aspartate/methionine/tyrosine aminotransferase